jgi:hypothetical protein
MKETPGDATGTRPEVELLLRCARVSLGAACAERVGLLLGHDLDWAYLLPAAEAHGTAALLYWHLSRVSPRAVPAAALESLRRRFHDTACYNLLLTGELLRLLGLFAAHGVRAIPFKGPTLAAHAYGNLALRQFVDLDLLLCPPDLHSAAGLLAAEGYRPGLRLAPAQEAAYLASIGQVPLVREDGTCMVELHARIGPRDFYFPLGLERLWPRLRPLSLNGRDVSALAGEDLLLVLCAHGAKHLWSRLGWVCDVAELLRARPALDWPAVGEEARSLRCERILLLGLLLAHDLLQAPVPQDLLRRARSVAAVRALSARLCGRMFRQADGRPAGLDNALLHIRARERLRDGLRYALSLALTPRVTDWTALQVPAPLSFLYRLLRPVRLARKYGRRLWENRPGSMGRGSEGKGPAR